MCVGAGGVAAAAIAAALGVTLPPPAYVLAAKKIYEEMDVPPPNLNDTQSVMNTINGLQKYIDDNLHNLTDECRNRHAALQKLSASDLLLLGSSQNPS